MPLRSALAPLVLGLFACAGAGTADTGGGSGEQDVRGVYALAWSDRVTVRLAVAGAAQETESDADGVVTFEGPDGEPLALDLAAWCADPGVNCPTEAWPTRVAIDQDEPDATRDVHTLRAWNADAPGAVAVGAVDHATDQLLFGLDAGPGSEGNCGVVGASLAGGTFVYGDTTADSGDVAGPPSTELESARRPGTPDASGRVGAPADGAASFGPALPAAPGPAPAAVPSPAGVVGIGEGAAAVGWLGVCAWDALAVGATLSIEANFDADRVGDL